jgi:MoaA/NifB/PqqE/SkfB family radical SAM enzyme
MNLNRGNDIDLPEQLLIKTLDQLPWVEEMFFVGLGEPLLHPSLPAFISLAARRRIFVRLVTNGLVATPETLARLRDAGLSEVTFSLDSTDEAVFRKLRGNAPLGTVLNHFRSVPAGLAKAIFTTLSAANAGSLAGMVELAAAEGLPAVAVTDLNFAANQPRSLARNDCAESLAAGIARAREKNVLLVGPHFHETPDLLRSVRRSLVRTAADLTRRTAFHRHCLAPWRVAVISASGNLSPCNCAPLAVGASIQDVPFCELWNGQAMQAWRGRVLAGTSPDCLVCPRY